MQIQEGYHLFRYTCVVQNLSRKLVKQTLSSAAWNHRDRSEDRTCSQIKKEKKSEKNWWVKSADASRGAASIKVLRK